MAKNIKIQETPNLIGQSEVFLNKETFDAAVYSKGYEVYHDKIIKCPCYTTSSEWDASKQDQVLKAHNSSSCRNCGGTGYVVMQRVQTKMILQAMNFDTAFKDWTEEKIGTVKVTALHKDKLSFMDRITLIKAESIYNEILHPTMFGDSLYDFLAYEPKKIELITLFEGDGKQLKRLTLNDYSIAGNKIILKNKYYNTKNELKLSVKYSYKPQFYILDLLRDVISSDTLQNGEVKKAQQFPVHAIGRRSHFVVDKPNFNGNYLIDNTIPC